MQRGFTLPAASTASAKAARSAFFCSLCQKGYSRINEFEAHESSYDHQHKKRLKEMKEMQRQVVQPKKEEKGPLMQIKLGGSGKSVAGSSGAGTSGGFKKGGFKSAFAAAEDEVEVKKEQDGVEVVAKLESAQEVEMTKEEDVDSDVTDQEDYYDPRRPTGCTPACASVVARNRG